ncbi:MAG: T9SS type A sorting domain-containing protein [Melioribacteraceae bacterium]|nr:T9SS type A sorting domain-containing protein [Melioribacteraceae bacterium]
MKLSFSCKKFPEDILVSLPLINTTFFTFLYFQIKLNAENLASGIYLYQIKTGSFTDTRKMILIR